MSDDVRITVVAISTAFGLWIWGAVCAQWGAWMALRQRGHDVRFWGRRLFR